MARRSKRTIAQANPNAVSDVLTGKDVLLPVLELVWCNPNDRHARERLRYKHCVGCRLRREQSEVERAAYCASTRCNLCDPEELNRERRMMAVALSLRDPNNAPDDLVEMLNEHIQRCGCATIGLGARQQGGFRRLAYEGGTLRAVVHRGIILFLSSLAGDRIHVNIHDVSTLDRLVEIGRAVLAPVEEEEAQARRDRVLALDAQGYTVSEIHRETGLARVKVNEILVAEGRKEKGRKYTAL